MANPPAGSVHLFAGSSQACDLDDGPFTKAKPRSPGQGQHIESFGRDVFAEIARSNGKPAAQQFLEQFFMDQMDLPQVRGTRFLPNIAIRSFICGVLFTAGALIVWIIGL